MVLKLENGFQTLFGTLVLKKFEWKSLALSIVHQKKLEMK